MGLVLQLHEDLWKMIFDVWTSDKQVGHAWQTHVYARIPIHRAACAQKVANMICKCVWETHHFSARVTFEGRDNLRDLGQHKDAKIGWEVHMEEFHSPS